MTACLALASLAGCASRGTVEGVSFAEAWEIAAEVLAGRGQIVHARSGDGRFRVLHSRYYPFQDVVERIAAPPSAEPFYRRTTVVDVRLEEAAPKRVYLAVSAWTEYSAFSRHFDTEHDGKIQRSVLSELLQEMSGQEERAAALRELARGRAALRAAPRAGMCLVPAGPFTLGTADGHPDEGPARQVELQAYWIDAHEVAVGDFKRFIAAGGYRERRWWSPEGWAWREMFGVQAPQEWKPAYRDSLPVFGVSWYEAEAYARWAGKRLPTEAQWEKAARYSLPSRYPWGNRLISAVNCLSTLSRYGPLPVDALPANRSAVGCYQMAGNVAEWCRDWYAPDAYRRAKERDPLGPPAGSLKVLRGGSFFDGADGVRATFRDRGAPEDRSVAHGFRCVVEVAPS